MKRTILLTLVIIPAAIIAAVTGIASDGGGAPATFESVRGEEIMLHGAGIYRHMSADVAIQGIAQDWVTLAFALPLLLVTLITPKRRSPRVRLVRAGVLGYLLVTYLFYLMMATYNELFLVYVLLLGTTFFAFLVEILAFPTAPLHESIRSERPGVAPGVLLIANASLVALLWLSVVVPPLLDGTVIPTSVQHYTTLVVQGLDLGLLLPLAVVSGVLWLRRHPLGSLAAPVYLVFLTILMTALVAKLIAMGMYGSPVMPAIVIIPAILVATVAVTVHLLAGISQTT